MYERFTDRARRIMQLANQEAQRFNHEYIGTEHMLLGIVKEGTGGAAIALKNLDVDLRKIRLEIEKLVQSGPEMITMGKLPQTPRAKKAIEYSMEEARNMGQSFVGTEHVLLGVLRVKEGVAAEVLQNLDVSIESVKVQAKALAIARGDSDEENSGSNKTKKAKKSKTPALDAFTRDITELARIGKLRPVVEREPEIDRLATVLSRLNRHNAILIGEAGVGRRSIVNGLAHQIADRSIRASICDCRVVELDHGMIVAGTKYRGQFEERIKAIANEMRRARNVILFAPQIHLLGRLGVFSDSGLSAFDILKHTMVRGEIRCVGTCSAHEYAAHIGIDPSLVSLFQPIKIAAPTKDQTLEYLRGLKKIYEDHHRVEVKDEALQAAVELSNLYILDRPFPVKALDLVDEAGAQLGMKRSPPDTSELDEQIEDLDAKKETAVDEQDFVTAAQFLSEANELKSQRATLESQWQEDQDYGTVDIEDIVRALSLETGISEADIRERRNVPKDSEE